MWGLLIRVLLYFEMFECCTWNAWTEYYETLRHCSCTCHSFFLVLIMVLKNFPYKECIIISDAPFLKVSFYHIGSELFSQAYNIPGIE
jgi:hypothetical protein